MKASLPQVFRFVKSTCLGVMIGVLISFAGVSATFADDTR